jgi:predicted glycogen debranching enzyme
VTALRQIAVSGPSVQQPQQAVTYEWLSTNGLGGFASGTVGGINTRRYHAVLLAAPKVENRFVLLAQLLEEVRQGDRSWSLGAAWYPDDVIHPQGYTHLHRFTPYPYPTWIYTAGDWIIEKQLTMVKGANTTVVRYRLAAGDGKNMQLVIRPLFAGRDYHATRRATPECFHVSQKNQCLIVSSAADMPTTWLGCNTGEFSPEEVWYENVRYPAESARGLDDEEDLFAPGRITFTNWDRDIYLVITAEEPDYAASAAGVEAYGRQAFTRVAEEQERLLALAQHPPGVAALLTLAADAFVIRRGRTTSIIAGYPWFTDWGRDTMIALPGLLLATGRAEEALSTLKTFAAAAQDGLIPNRFPDRHSTPEYNTVDAALWFIYACERYVTHTNSPADLEPIWPVIKAIITGYLAGTRFNIQVDKRGLVHAGAANTQLTWMDAKVGDWVVTPRQGFPVEISALWYNALRSAAALCSRWDKRFSTLCYEQAELTKRHFAATFWDAERDYLADVVDAAGQVDASLRPNQLFAMSLPYPVFTGKDAVRAVRRVWQELLTPMGIRSLAATDTRYRGVYAGDQWQRDGAYHQGTVWAWLMGPFISAYIKTHGAGRRQLNQARLLLAPLFDHLEQAGLGHISEIFSGDSPHLPAGCPAQAWSVAELLRLWAEEFARAPLELDL